MTSLDSNNFTKYASQVTAAGDHLNLGEELIHGAVASVADFGVSVYNSLPIPGKIDASTEDLLSRIDKDALQVYNEHPDAVHTASFIGGVFVPAGLAFKGMKLLREGSKSVNVFSEAGNASRMAQVEEAFKNGGTSSKLYREAKTSVYMATAANAIADNVAAEAAIVLTMNAHPYMEDYMKDLPSNFLYGAAIGSGLGVGIGAIAAKFAMAQRVMPLEQGMNKRLFDAVTDADVTANVGYQMLSHGKSIEELKGVLAKHASQLPEDKDFILTPFELQRTKLILENREAKLVDTFDGIASGELKAASMDVKAPIMNLLSTNLDTASADSIRFLEMGKDALKPTVETGLVKGAQNFLKDLVTKNEAGKEVTKLAPKDVVYDRTTGSFFDATEAQHYSNIADAVAGKDIEAIRKSIKKGEFEAARKDASMELQSGDSALAELDHAKAFLFAASKDAKTLQDIDMHYKDVAVLRAVLNKAITLANDSPVEASLYKFKVLGADGVVVKQSIPELHNTLMTAEKEVATDLALRDFPVESIARRLGLDVTSVQNSLLGDNMGVAAFTSEADIIKRIGQENRSLVMSTAMEKIPYSELRGQAHGKLMDSMSAQITEQVILSSSSSLVQDLGKILFGGNAKLRVKYLEDGIDQVTQSGLKNTLLRSANDVVEHFGQAGLIMTEIGADIAHTSNVFSEQLLRPIANAITTIKNDVAKVTELNMARTVYASLEGKRTWKDGQFWVQDRDPITQTLLTTTDETGKVIPKLVAAKFQGKEFTATSPEVIAIMDAFGEAGKHMYELINARSKILGGKDLVDIGYWIPAFNPRNKEIGYVINNNGSTSILWGKTAGELLDKARVYEQRPGFTGKVLLKGRDQEYYNKIAGREDPLDMAMADVSQLHTGASASALLSTNLEEITDVINSYHHYINKGIADLVEIQLAPTMDKLKMISDISQLGHNTGTMGVVAKSTKSLPDAGMVAKNIILGRNNLTEHTGWAEWQQRTQVGTDLALDRISEWTAPLLNKVRGTDRDMNSWKELNANLKAKGYLPFEEVADYHRYIQEGVLTGEALTPRTIALANATMGTMLLKFGELAQPFVNMISLPILTSGAVRKIMAKEFMGTAYDESAKFVMPSIMHDAVRLMMHPVEGVRLSNLAIERNIFEPIVSEANRTLHEIHSFNTDAMASGERAIEKISKSILSRPADWSETKVRQMSFFNGIVIARKAYPGLSDEGQMTFARAFMNEALGNYSASQRPAAFQGTFGVALGLFQTYMLTLAQHIYRGIERKDWVGLSKQMFAQGTIFGASSLPGFHVVSEQIGNHFSDQNYDLETGTFRAVGDKAASMILYGLPSSFGPGVTTRGDIQPRLPNPIQGLDSLAAYNIGKQAWSSLDRLASAATNADGNTGQAFMEALSVQSVSRPIARWSELLSGRSVTASGNVIAQGAEIYTTTGIISRLMATRPLEEIKAREAMQLDSVYGAFDRQNRKELIGRLKTHIASGNLDGEVIQKLQFDYLRTGSPSGWRSAYSEAVNQTAQSGSESVKDHLKPSAPWQQLVDDIDN